MHRVIAVSIILAIVASIGLAVYLHRGSQTIPTRRAELREIIAVQEADYPPRRRRLPTQD
jgi:hypothetical protein